MNFSEDIENLKNIDLTPNSNHSVIDSDWIYDDLSEAIKDDILFGDPNTFDIIKIVGNIQELE